MLGGWMVIVFRRIHRDQLAAEARAAAKIAKAKSSAIHEVALDTRLVSVLNDHPTIEHEHILLALHLTIDDVRVELRERRRQKVEAERE